MDAFKNGDTAIALRLPAIGRVTFRAFQVLLYMVLIESRLWAEPSAPTAEAQSHLDEYAKLLGILQESHFKYTASTTRSTPGEGLSAKMESRGTVSVSAARRLFYHSKTSTATWTKRTGQISQDLGTTEILVTPEAAMQVLSRADRSNPAEKHFGVEINRQVTPDDWSRELLSSELALLLGYVPQGGPKDKLDTKRNSLLAICRKAALETVRDQPVGSKKLAGFVAKTADFEIRMLFDPANDHQLQQIEVSRPANKVEPFGFEKGTVHVLEIRNEDKNPSLIRGKTTMQIAGGVVMRSQPPKNVRLTAPQKESDRIKTEPQTYEHEFELTDIAYQEDSKTPWFALESEIPDGTLVDVKGKEGAPHFWQDGQVKQGFPPPPESEIRERIEAAFGSEDSPVERYERSVREIDLSRQHCLVVFADSQAATTRSLFRAYLANEEHANSLSDFRVLAVPTNAEKSDRGQTLAKRMGVTLADDRLPILAITNEKGLLLGQVGRAELFDVDAPDVSTERIQAFLRRHAPPRVDAQTLLTEAFERARREDKRILLQQTASWCGPCWLLTRFLNERRSVWEKDYVWLRIDERWANADKVIKRFRKEDSGGIPWIAILNSEGKPLTTSDRSNGENIGFPSPEEPAGIEHFMGMLKSTARRLTAMDLDTLQKALESK